LSKQNRKAPPYSMLATIYDEVMAHVDYEKWTNYIVSLFEKYDKKPQSILELSCGTGNVLLSLTSKKYNIFGLDLSFEMVRIAYEKAITRNININYFQADMTCFSLKRPVDVVICLYDSINYLDDFSKWQQLFDNVYDALVEQGLFIFDICTEKNSMKYFSNYTETGSGSSFEYLRESSYDRKQKIHQNQFTIKFDGDDNRYIESHQQRIYTINEIQNFISQSHFQCLDAFNGFSFRKADEEALRVHFVLEKASLND